MRLTALDDYFKVSGDVWVHRGFVTKLFGASSARAMDSEIGRPRTASAGCTTATGLASRSMMTSVSSRIRVITKAKSMAASDSEM